MRVPLPVAGAGVGHRHADIGLAALGLEAKVDGGRFARQGLDQARARKGDAAHVVAVHPMRRNAPKQRIEQGHPGAADAMREEHLIGAEAVRGERRQIDPCELGEAADRHHVPDRLAGRDRPPLVEAGIVAHEQDAQVRDGGQLRPARVDGGTIAFIDDVEDLEIAHARRAVAGERGDGGDLLRDRPAFRRQAERGEEVRSLRHAGAFRRLQRPRRALDAGANSLQIVRRRAAHL